MGNIIPHPLTFHVQVRQDPATQQQAQDLQRFFAQPTVVAALDQASPRLVHFARILHIPNYQPFDPQGISAVQVVLVYDGESMAPLLDFMWNTPSLRSLFQQLHTMQRPLPKPGLFERCWNWLRSLFGKKDGRKASPTTFSGFCAYIQYNNLTPLRSELHRGYNLSVDQVVHGFPPPPPVTQGSTPA